MMDVTDWLNEYGGEGFALCVKRLSGNDTLANEAHQAGPYLPKAFLFEVLPSINRTDVKNPDHWFTLYVDSHPDTRKIRAVYYNSRLSEGRKSGRNETRLTNFGGRSSALLDPESTGALTVFAFTLGDDGQAMDCHVWVCRDETEEDVVEERVGPVEPGRWAIVSPSTPRLPLPPSVAPVTTCWLAPGQMPSAWLTTFPTGAEIIAKVAMLQPHDSLMVDKRLMKRRECEYEIFRSIEEAVELPAIKAGFRDIDAFVSRAQSILQRRKARAGRSLELHTRQIFIEEKLVQGVHFDHQCESEAGNRPDFIFPSKTAYQDPDFPAAGLRMLAVKTTLKDRWRQILKEADRIPEKHLLTLQEGISEAQFKQMVDARVRLVVPQPNIEKFPKSVQPHLQTLESFIGDVRLLSG